MATVGREMASFFSSLTALGTQQTTDTGEMRKIYCLQTKMKTVK